MAYRVQEISVDGSHIHEQRYVFPENARDFAERIAEAGSPLLGQVVVLDDRFIEWREVFRLHRG